MDKYDLADSITRYEIDHMRKQASDIEAFIEDLKQPKKILYFTPPDYNKIKVNDYN